MGGWGKKRYICKKSCYKCKATTATALMHRGGHLWIGINSETCRKCPNGYVFAFSNAFYFQKIKKIKFPQKLLKKFWNIDESFLPEVRMRRCLSKDGGASKSAMCEIQGIIRHVFRNEREIRETNFFEGTKKIRGDKCPQGRTFNSRYYPFHIGLVESVYDIRMPFASWYFHLKSPTCTAFCG